MLDEQMSLHSGNSFQNDFPSSLKFSMSMNRRGDFVSDCVVTKIQRIDAGLEVTDRSDATLFDAGWNAMLFPVSISAAGIVICILCGFYATRQQQFLSSLFFPHLVNSTVAFRDEPMLFDHVQAHSVITSFILHIVQKCSVWELERLFLGQCGSASSAFHGFRF